LKRQGVIGALSGVEYITNLGVIVAGAVLMMWLGELLSEFGIGNGLSLLIVAGIVAALPQQVTQLLFTYDPSQLPTYIAFGIFAILMIAGIVFVTEAERPVQVQYARQVRGTTVSGGTSTYLPIRLNQAGVMPIIFAMSLLLFPQLLANFLGTSANETLQGIARSLVLFLQNELWYGIVYFILIFVFTYFYTAVTFDPKQIATNLQKNGAFIPGIRPRRINGYFLIRNSFTNNILRCSFLRYCRCYSSCYSISNRYESNCYWGNRITHCGGGTS
jgi:preprotein translocase subunit SecY